MSEELPNIDDLKWEEVILGAAIATASAILVNGLLLAKVARESGKAIKSYQERKSFERDVLSTLELLDG